jgi:hypothetical protein
VSFKVGEWVLLKESEWDDELREMHTQDPLEPSKIAAVDPDGQRIRLWYTPERKRMSPWFPAKNWKLAAEVCLCGHSREQHAPGGDPRVDDRPCEVDVCKCDFFYSQKDHRADHAGD